MFNMHDDYALTEIDFSEKYNDLVLLFKDREYSYSEGHTGTQKNYHLLGTSSCTSALDTFLSITTIAILPQDILLDIKESSSPLLKYIDVEMLPICTLLDVMSVSTICLQDSRICLDMILSRYKESQTIFNDPHAQVLSVSSYYKLCCEILTLVESDSYLPNFKNLGINSILCDSRLPLQPTFLKKAFVIYNEFMKLLNIHSEESSTASIKAMLSVMSDQLCDSSFGSLYG